MSIEFIEKEGKRFTLVPAEVYERMLNDLDDVDDIRAYDRAKAEPQEFYPAEIVDRMLDGESPVKVFREYRGMTQKALAEAVGVAALYISQIERGDRQGSARTLKKIAAALNVPLDLLVA